MDSSGATGASMGHETSGGTGLKSDVEHLAPYRGLRILHVEDDPLIAAALRRHLVHIGGLSMRILLLGVLGLVSCGSITCYEKTELVRIEQPAVPQLGELAVDMNGTYLLWHPGDPSQKEQRGELTPSELEGVQRASAAKVELMACASADFDRCKHEQRGYVMSLPGATGCWVASEVEASCEVSEHFMTLVALLDTISKRHQQ